MTAPTPGPATGPAPDSLGAEPDFAPAAGHTPDVEYAVAHRIGRVRLNRPKAINSLTTAMCTSLRSQLLVWAQDDVVGAVFIEGAGEKGLCAGGDVRALREWIQAGELDAVLHFWEEEYALNGLIADYPKPYVAWMDGVTMGGGVGVSSHGSRRLVTERSRVAMPETIIGLFPDVGGLFYLAHAPGELGTHVALTGLPVSGADAVVLGLADRVVASDSKDRVLAHLAAELEAGLGREAAPEAGTVADSDARTGRTEEQLATGQDASASALERQRSWIDECYRGDDAAQILRRLQQHDDPAAQDAAETLAARSPHSIVVTLEAVRRARGMTVHEVLAQDARLGPHFATHPDFAEGVRALLVDKDQAPRWADASVADVDRARALAAFDG